MHENNKPETKMYLHEYDKSRVKMYLRVCVKYETSQVEVYSDNNAQDTSSNYVLLVALFKKMYSTHSLPIQHIIANYHFSVFVIVATD